MSKILAVGSIAYDTIETWAGKEEYILGGSASYFSMAASLMSEVSIVAVVGEDFDKSDIDLFKSRNIDTSGLVIEEGKTFHWEGLYPKNGDAKTIKTDLNVFETFSPKLQNSQKEAKILFLGNINPKLQNSLIDQMKSTDLIVLDTMNFWISKSKDILLETISKIDVLLINETEIKMLSGEDHLIDAVKYVNSVGPKIIIVKFGARGVSLFHKDDHFVMPACPVDKVIDPTGAGDTFAGGFIGYLATKDESFTFEDFKTATVYGNLTASYTIEGFGLTRLKELDKGNLDKRLNLFRNYVRF